MTPLEAQAKLDSAIEEYGTRATLTSASSVVVDEREGTVTKSDSTRSIMLSEDHVEVTAVDGVYVAEATATVRLDEEVQVGELAKLDADTPKLKPEDQFYWDAFWRLNRDRDFGMGEGYIPFQAIDCFARRYDIDDWDFEDLFSNITAMDTVYMEEKEKKRPKGKN